MAAPESVTIKDLTGTFVMNKEESGEIDPVLQLQGIGWIIRKAIGMMPVTLVIKQYTDDKGVVHIDIEQPGAAGIKGTTELRTINGEWTEHEDHIFGAVKGVSKWKKVSDYSDNDEDEKFLKAGWDKATVDGDVIDGYVESINNGWIARQCWGFKEINGARKYTRNIIVKKGEKVQRVTLYYDYKGPPKA